MTSRGFDTLRRQVSAAVEAALVEEGRVRGREVGEGARQSAARAVVGEGELDEGGLREAFGHEPPLSLVAFDADRIQRWVFDTNRPAVIGGASHQLDALGQELRDLERLGAGGWGGVIYSGGGTGLALVASARAEALRSAIEERCARLCPGLTMSTASLPVWPSALVGGHRSERQVEGFGVRLVEGRGLTATLSRLHGRLRAAKDGTMPPAAALRPASGKQRGGDDREGRCQCCYVRPATTSVPRPEARTLPACEVCKARWDTWNAHVKEENAWGLSFVDIAERSSSRRKYLAVLIADGNSMGRIFQRVGRLDTLAALSAEVTEIYGAARSRCLEELELGGEDGRGDFLSLLTGGDEVVLLLPGDRGLRAARRVLATIHDEARRSADSGLLSEAFGDEPEMLDDLRRMSAGVGLVVASPKLPVRHLLELAQGLERSAKAGAGRAQSAVDFEVLTGGAMLPVDPARLRKLQKTSGDLRRTAKPYTFGELEAFLADLAHSRSAPRSQLYLLRGGLGEGRHAFLNHALYQFGRNVQLYGWGRRHGHESPSDFERWLVRKGKDGQWTTWVEDLLEVGELDWQPEEARR